MYKCLGRIHCRMDSPSHSIDREKTALWFEVKCLGVESAAVGSFLFFLVVCMRS